MDGVREGQADARRIAAPQELSFECQTDRARRWQADRIAHIEGKETSTGATIAFPTTFTSRSVQVADQEQASASEFSICRLPAHTPQSNARRSCYCYSRSGGIDRPTYMRRLQVV